ncbi:DUF6328 family protein [Cellulomonas sp. Y8]|uniref:DUF6328 family protein n=1 Tax=Cellulomonas sp. Y8 TaxID=2591145 RepID=UPI0011CCB110|nr:DUF6328 family protein [Cellulomonas sp. Y8]
MPQHDSESTRPEDLDADPRDGRSETATERMDRNWNELLQELRVAQTGVQILTGFLLTVPFQQRFLDLDDYQKTVYLVLVVLALTATAFIVAPVSLHRILFRRHLKRELVDSADRMAQTGLAALALVLGGSALLLFDVVVGRTAGIVAGAVTLTGLAVVWVALPWRLSHRARRETA